MLFVLRSACFCACCVFGVFVLCLLLLSCVFALCCCCVVVVVVVPLLFVVLFIIVAVVFDVCSVPNKPNNQVAPRSDT